VLSALFSLKMRCACHFILNGVVRNSSLDPRAALKPQEPRSSGPWTPGAPAPAEVLGSRGVVVVESWQVASCRCYLCSREGGPHTPPTPETS
jgi:hypothetical protein